MKDFKQKGIIFYLKSVHTGFEGIAVDKIDLIFMIFSYLEKQSCVSVLASTFFFQNLFVQ